MAKRKVIKMTDFPEETPTRPDIPSVLPPPISERVPEPATIDLLDAYRLAASMLLEYAVDGAGHGVRSTADPVYRTVVEGRVGPKYSSCGDLAHWLLYRLGVRASFINRAEFKAFDGGHGWRVGLNLNLLCAPPIGTCPVAVHPAKLEEVPDIQPGDLLQISNQCGGHEICVAGREDGPDGIVLFTAEYGQPGGAKKEHGLKLIGGSLWLTNLHGANQVVSWIPLAAALALPGRVAPDVNTLATAGRETLGKGLPGFVPAPSA